MVKSKDLGGFYEEEVGYNFLIITHLFYGIYDFINYRSVDKVHVTLASIKESCNCNLL